jgi:3-deoxy-D-manno-octulosonate 8-phosphate phosphatase (KDO 8-P phosphatase)
MGIRERSGEHGVRFLTGEHDLQTRISRIKAVLFDWDGVFNDGFKDERGGSPFSEVDSMGVNLLRYALWRGNARTNPVAAIISGQQNHLAEKFAGRERFHALYMGFTNKPEAFDALLGTHGLRPEEVAFFFDDVLDLPIAAECGVRILISHRATHHFQRTVEGRGAADIIIPIGGGHHGLRMACELLIALQGEWEKVIEERVNYSTDYQAYLAARNAVRTAVNTAQR